MQMLGRLALGCFDRLSSFRCRRTIGLRSVHVAPSWGRTGTLTHQADNPVSPAAGGDPRWVMLSTCLRHRDTCFADAKNVAESSTSNGRGFRLSADLAAPPASSFLCYDGEDPDIDPELLLAAHGDSILFGLRRRSSGDSRPWTCTHEYFVYRAAAAGRPASVSPQLPTHDFSTRFDDEAPTHTLHGKTTGILRRGEDDELLVVELGVRNRSDSPSGTIDLNVLQVGSSWGWERRWAVPVVDVDGSRGYGLQQWTGHDRVIPVGDRFLCWVKYSDGFLLCDMADPNLMLRSMPLPVAPREGRRGNGRYIYHEDDDRQMQYCRNMCGAGADVLKFVSIDPRCCCGGPGRGTCPHSSFAFTVTTWSMSLSMDEQMAWVMDGVLDCEELWDLPGYEGLPCVAPSCPVVSPVNPDVICFRVTDCCLLSSSEEKKKVWMLEVDTRRKVLLSVVLCHEEPDDHLPAKFYC